MDYIKWMLDRGDPQGGYSLTSVKKLLEILNNPQDKIKIIHVAGTNGKGSVVNYLSQAFIKSGAKCGTFTSPYIDNICESIEINGSYIPEDEFIDYLKRIYPLVTDLDEKNFYTTSFEIFSALAYLYFYDKKVDLAVIEVGMGGRTDGTNTMKAPLASVITSLSLDHVAILGNTIEEIAYQKGGIIKDGVDVFLYPQVQGAYKVIKDIAEEKQAKLYTFSLEDVKILKSDEHGNVFTFKGEEYKTSLIGPHQAYNASLAIMVLKTLKDKFNLTDSIIKEAIRDAKNIARLELMSHDPVLLLDGSHNMDGIKVLLSSLKNFNYNRLILGFSMLKDKDIKHVLEKLIPLADQVVLTEINNPRKSDLKDLKNAVEKYKKDTYAITNIEEAFKKTIELANKDDLILWCGSLYLMADIRKCALKYLKNKNAQ